MPCLPGMHPHCSNLASLHSASCLSMFTHACSLLTCLCSLVSIDFHLRLVSLCCHLACHRSKYSSGKPSGATSAVVVFLLIEILVPNRSLSFAAVFVVGPKALMSFVVSDWVHTGCMLTFKRKYYQCYSNAFRFIAIICIYGMHNTI